MVIRLGVGSQRWTRVDFDDPRLEVFVEENVESVPVESNRERC